MSLTTKRPSPSYPPSRLTSGLRLYIVIIWHKREQRQKTTSCLSPASQLQSGLYREVRDPLAYMRNHMKQRNKKIKVVSLFSGCGGADLGLLGEFSFLGRQYPALGFEIAWANEIEPVAADTYKKNIGKEIAGRRCRSSASATKAGLSILLLRGLRIKKANH